jgi:hypothetical protein
MRFEHKSFYRFDQASSTCSHTCYNTLNQTSDIRFNFLALAGLDIRTPRSGIVGRTASALFFVVEIKITDAPVVPNF